MSFADAMREEGRFTRTENGAVALNTSGDARLDLFGTIGSLREADENRITTLFAEAYAQDKLFATKIAFYARDIRGGLGERKIFRTIIRYMAEKHPEALRPNLDLVGVFGRYDDLYELIGTPLEDDMWAAMKKQFEEDLQNLNAGNAISLLAKWIKTADASSSATRKLGILTAQKLGYPVYNFKRIVRSMRKQIGVVESLMSAGRWDEIKYPEVPSRAMMIYRKAFMKHDAERFGEFISKAEKGEVKINASTLFPYDIVEKILYGRESNKVLEAQWKALPDYVEKGTNALVIDEIESNPEALKAIISAPDYFLDSYKKARLVGRVIKILVDEYGLVIDKKYNKFVEVYYNEIIKYRNALGHAMRSNEHADREVFIGEIDKTPLIFTEDLFRQMRASLNEYQQVINLVENSFNQI